MMRRIALGLLVATLAGQVLADDSYEQLMLKQQRAERKVEELERSTAQARAVAQELRKEIVRLSEDHKVQQQGVSDLTAKLKAVEEKQSSLAASLEQLKRETDQKTSFLGSEINARTVWYGVAFAFLLLLLGCCYWYIQRRHVMSERSLSEKVKGVFDSVRFTQEKIAKSDKELADSLFDILSQLKNKTTNEVTALAPKSAEPEHGLPLKLADEIHRMHKRLILLPEETKGLKPLQKSLERLTAELADQGYEVVDHTGMEYTENLSVSARFVPSDEMGPGQRIISKVVVPQVNYKGVMIRMADIEVSIGS